MFLESDRERNRIRKAKGSDGQILRLHFLYYAVIEHPAVNGGDNVFVSRIREGVVTDQGEFEMNSRLAMVSCLVLGGPLSFAVDYNLIDLGSLGGGQTSGLAINNLGQIVGAAHSADGINHAFVYSKGQMIDLGAGAGSAATGINNSGQIIGQFTDGAFLYSMGQLTNLGSLGGGGTYARSINNSGEIVGTSLTAGGSNDAFLYSNGQMTDLGTFGGTWSVAYGINDSGQVLVLAGDSTGHEHFSMYSNGQVTNLGLFGMAGVDYAMFNNSGEVAGWGSIAGQPVAARAFLYSQGQVAYIGPSGTLSDGLGMNNLGAVVGSAGPDGSVTHAYLYSNGHLTNLESLLTTEEPGWNLFDATAINDSGWIVVRGMRGGEFHTFLAEPGAVPEPLTLALCAAALGLAVRRGRKSA